MVSVVFHRFSSIDFFISRHAVSPAQFRTCRRRVFLYLLSFEAVLQGGRPSGGSLSSLVHLFRFFPSLSSQLPLTVGPPFVHPSFPPSSTLFSCVCRFDFQLPLLDAPLCVFIPTCLLFGHHPSATARPFSLFTVFVPDVPFLRVFTVSPCR